MARSLYVVVGGRRISAEALPLDARELETAQESWKADYRLDPGHRSERAWLTIFHWRWATFVKPFAPVYRLSVEGIVGYVGLIATDQLAVDSQSQGCVGIDYVAKSPSARAQGIRGVATALIARALEESVGLGMGGRAVIAEAFGADPNDETENPASLYRHLGFRTLSIHRYADGVEWERLEMREPEADALLSRFQHGS